MISEDAGRPFHYIRDKRGPDDLDPGEGNFAVVAGRVPGTGWADSSNSIPLHGFSENGMTAPGPVPINCTNNNETYSFHRGGAVVVKADDQVEFNRPGRTQVPPKCDVTGFPGQRLCMIKIVFDYCFAGN